MKKAKQTLTAALAATLATGVVGSVASAAPIDDLYKAAYNAMVKAQTEKTQTAINEARVAINALPKELDGAKGEFSKQVDAVQQPIYTQIIALIEKGQKEAKQETVNEGRKLLVGVEEAYAKTWSSNLDTIQQTIVKNATDAIAAAAKSQKAEDIEKAKALVAELKTAENADVKKAVEGMEKDLVEKINIYVEKVTAMNATTLEVAFSKDVDSNTIDKEKFVLKNGNVRVYVKSAELVSGKNNTVKLTLETKLDEKKEYALTVSDIKDAKGGKFTTATVNVKYDKKEIASVEFTSKKVVRNGDVRKILLVKDDAGRDITKEASLTFACTSDKDIISKDGKISSTAKIGKEVTIRVYSGDKILAEEKVTVAENLAETLIGFTVSKESVGDDTKYADLTANNKMKVRTDHNILTIFYKDAIGNEKKIEGGKVKKIESLNKDIVSIDNGTLAAKKEGIATIKVQYGDITEELQVEVVNSNIEVGTLTMDNTLVSVAKSDVDNAVPFKFVNSANAKDDVTLTAAEVKVWNETTSKWDYTSGVKADKENNLVVVNGNGLRKGDTAAKLIVTYGNVKYEQEFTINVKGADDIKSYQLVSENEATKIGKELTTIDQKDGEKAYLKVYAIDANGNRVSNKQVGVKSAALYVDGDDKGSKIDITQAISVESLNLEKGDHSYYVKVVKVDGTYDTNSITVTSDNTDDTVSSMSVDKSTTTGSSLASLINWVYGDEQEYNSATRVVEIVVDSAEGTKKVKYDGTEMSFKAAIDKAIATAKNNGTKVGVELDKIVFNNSNAHYHFNVKQLKVVTDSTTSPETTRIIYPDQAYDIDVQ